MKRTLMASIILLASQGIYPASPGLAAETSGERLSATSSGRVVQDEAEIARIENEFRDRYRREVESPNTSVARLQQILEELYAVAGQLAQAHRLATFEMKIKYQMRVAEQRQQEGPGINEVLSQMSAADRQQFDSGLAYMQCAIIAFAGGNQARAQAAHQKVQQVADHLAARYPHPPEAWAQAIGILGERSLGGSQVEVDRLKRECPNWIGQ